ADKQSVGYVPTGLSDQSMHRNNPGTARETCRDMAYPGCNSCGCRWFCGACVTYCHGTFTKQSCMRAVRLSARREPHSSRGSKMNCLSALNLTGSKSSTRNRTLSFDPVVRSGRDSITNTANKHPGRGPYELQVAT